MLFLPQALTYQEELQRVHKGHEGEIGPKRHKSKGKMGAFKVTITAEDDNRLSSESCGIVIAHVGPNAKSQWILDSGAMCHMCM